jgi:PAS domain S-box-containing protein
MAGNKVQESYSTILEKYVTAPDENYLCSAAELGREMILKDIPLEEISEIHEQALSSLAQKMPGVKLTDVLHLASAPLMEVLMSYGLDFREKVHYLSQAKDDLRKNEQHLRNILECLPLPIYVIGRDHRIIYWNRAMEEISGIKASDAIGRKMPRADFYGAEKKPLADLLVDERPNAVRRMYAGNVTESTLLEGAFEATDFFPRLGGHGKWLQSTASVLKDLEGNTVGAIEALDDITDRKHAERSLREYSTALEKSNRELENFAYIASHDLQEPLRMVASFVKLLARRYEGKLGDDADDFIRFAVEGAERMQLLINDLLAYSRIMTRGRDFEPIDCNSVLETVISDLRFALEDSGAVVKCSRLPTVLADRSQLRQLFQNMISNAIKFRRIDHPQVDIAAEKKEEEWVFSIRDNGIGIEPSCWDRIFEIFQRSHSASEYPGTGIGLAICKKIVERHDGEIWVNSQVDQGTTFFFTLPAL